MQAAREPAALIVWKKTKQKQNGFRYLRIALPTSNIDFFSLEKNVVSYSYTIYLFILLWTKLFFVIVSDVQKGIASRQKKKK